MSYSKIKLRTKTSAAVQVADLDARELAYGAGGTEDSIFVKNPTGTLRRFMYVDDAASSIGHTWSSSKIASMISAVTGDHTTITDWETAFTDSFNTRLATKTTDNVAEGVANLYYTNARARASVSVSDTNSIDMTYSSVSGNFSADVKVDTGIMEVTAAGVRVKNAGITATQLASNIDMSAAGFNADMVDSKHVDDAQSTNGYLWTAAKVIEFVGANVDGLDWQESVKSMNATTPPISPVIGDRYIVAGITVPGVIDTVAATKSVEVPADLTATLNAGDTIKIKGAATVGVNGQYTIVSRTYSAGTATTTIVVAEAIADSAAEGSLIHSDGAWSPVGPDEIVRWTGVAWTNVSEGLGFPNQGWCCLVEDENTEYVFNGSDWASKATATNHNNLSTLQGGTVNQYYHLNSTEHNTLTGWSTSKAANMVLASPNGAAGVSSFRALVSDDLPSLLHDKISDWNEAVQDTVGNMVSSNTEGNIVVTYDDATGVLNFDVNTATTSVTGVAKFSAGDFDVVAGNVTIKAAGIDASQVNFGTAAGQISTTVLPEGTNLYYTDVRARAALSITDTTSINMSYDNSTGIFSAAAIVDGESIEIDAVQGIRIKIVDGGTF